jgi:hypothetical protein
MLLIVYAGRNCVSRTKLCLVAEYLVVLDLVCGNKMFVFLKNILNFILFYFFNRKNQIKT